MDEPKVAPHIVMRKLSKLAQEHGYSIQYGIELGYWQDGEHFVTAVRPAWHYDKERSDDG
jgi:hypothetical protein